MFCKNNSLVEEIFSLRKQIYLFILFSIPLYSVAQSDHCFEVSNQYVDDECKISFNQRTEKTIRLKFHIPRIKSPFWGFTQAQGNAQVDLVMNILNSKVNNNQQPSAGSTHPFLWDMRLNFELVEVEYYDFESFCVLEPDSFHSASNAQNIFFVDQCDTTGSCVLCAGGKSNYLGIPFSTWVDRPYYNFLDENNGSGFWEAKVADIIIHEIAHNAGLGHAFDDGPDSEQNCSDVFIANSACSYNNFMDGCAGAKTSLSPCQLLQIHDYLEGAAAQISEEQVVPGWTLTMPEIEVILDDHQNGLHYIGFNENDYTGLDVSYFWTVNDSEYYNSSALTFSLLQYEGQSIELCLNVLDANSGSIIEVCETVSFPSILDCQPNIQYITSEITVENNNASLPNNLSFEYGPLSNVHWTFESASGSTFIDEPCAEEPNLIYPEELIRYYGDTFYICVEQFRPQNNNGFCKSSRCDTIVIDPLIGPCLENDPVEFDHWFIFDLNSFDFSLKLLALDVGINKAIWKMSKLETGEITYHSGNLQEIALTSLNEYAQGLEVCLMVEDRIDHCVIGEECKIIDPECFNSIGIPWNGMITLENQTVHLYYTSQTDIEASDINVFLNNQLLTNIDWSASIPGSNELHGTYELSSNCGKFNFEMFIERECFSLAEEFMLGEPPCPWTPEDPDFVINNLYPNPSSSLTGITIDFNSAVNEMVTLSVLNQMGVVEAQTSIAAQIGNNQIFIDTYHCSYGVKCLQLVGDNEIITEVFMIR